LILGEILMSQNKKKCAALARDYADRVSVRLQGLLTVTTGFDASGNPTVKIGSGTTATQTAFVRFLEQPSIGTNAVGNAQDSYNPSIAQVALEAALLAVPATSTVAADNATASSAGDYLNNGILQVTTTGSHGLITGQAVNLGGSPTLGTFTGTYGPITKVSATVFTVPVSSGTGPGDNADGGDTVSAVGTLLDDSLKKIVFGELHMLMTQIQLWLSPSGTGPSVTTFSTTTGGLSGGPLVVYDPDVRFPLIGNM
jgi:hypothetical protein